MAQITLDTSDVLKIHDALRVAATHLFAKNTSDAAMHLAEVRVSPLTSTVMAAEERLRAILAEAGVDPRGGDPGSLPG